MKKLFPILVILAVFVLLLQFFVRLFIEEHEVKYSLKTKDNSYSISEKYFLDEDENNYLFQVVDQNQNTYTFNYQQDFNKQEQVIQDIKYYKDGPLECIFPVYKRDKSGDVSCMYKKKQVSYSYLVQINNPNINVIVKKLNHEGYQAPSWKKSANPEVYDTIQVYNQNIPENMTFTMWFYRGIYILKTDKSEKKDYLDQDQYENLFSTLVDNYYISLNTDVSDNYQYSEIYVYDIKNGGKATIDLKVPLSKNFYFQGEFNKKLYYVDLETKFQYVLNPSSEKVEEVGNPSKGYQIISKDKKKLEKVEASGFSIKDASFNQPITNKFLTTKYGATEIKKSGDYYYYKTAVGDFYRVLERDLKHPEKLFHFDKVSEWKVKDMGVSIVSGNTLYYYDCVVGLRPIATNNELVYNYKNICDFAKK